MRLVLVKSTNETSRFDSSGVDRYERVSEVYKAKERPQQDAAIEGMRHRYAGAVHQHQFPDAEQRNAQSNPAISQKGNSSPVAPLFSLPPPPPSQRERSTTSYHQNHHDLPCQNQSATQAVHVRQLQYGKPSSLTSQEIVPRPARQGCTFEAKLSRPQETSEASVASTQTEVFLFESRHCSFSTEANHTHQREAHISPQPSPSHLPPPLFSQNPSTTENFQYSANYQRGDIAQRKAGVFEQRDQKQLLQQQQCSATGLQQKNTSSQSATQNSCQGHINVCEPAVTNQRFFESPARDLQQQQPQLRAQRQLLVGSSLPINYCTKGAGELSRNNQAPPLQQHWQEDVRGLNLLPLPQIPQSGGHESRELDDKFTTRQGQQYQAPTYERRLVRNSSDTSSSNSSPPYGSSNQLWPESRYQEERRSRSDKQKVYSCFSLNRFMLVLQPYKTDSTRIATPITWFSSTAWTLYVCLSFMKNYTF